MTIVVPSPSRALPGLTPWQEWQSKPGNEGRSYAEFVEAIRGPRGGGAPITAGQGNAYTLATDVPVPVFSDGLRLTFVAHATNTGVATLNVNGNGPQELLRPDGLGGFDVLSAGDIEVGSHHAVALDASANSGAGAWILLNPSLGNPLSALTSRVGDVEAASAAHAALTDNPHAVTKAQIGLGSYPGDPTALPLSTATQAALNAIGSYASVDDLLAGTATGALMSPYLTAQAIEVRALIIIPDGLIPGDNLSAAQALHNSERIQAAIDRAPSYAEVRIPGLFQVAKNPALTGYSLGDQPCVTLRDKPRIMLTGVAGGGLWCNKHGQGVLDILNSRFHLRGLRFRGYAVEGKTFPPLDGATGLGEKAAAGKGYHKAGAAHTDIRNNSVDTSGFTTGGYGGAFPREDGGAGATWGTWGNGGYIGNAGHGVTIDDGSSGTVEECEAEGFNGWGFLAGSRHARYLGYAWARPDKVSFVRCHARNCYDGGFGTSDAYRVSVESCLAEDIGHPDASTAHENVNPGYGFASIQATGDADVTEYVTVLNSTFRRCKRKGIDTHGGTYISIFYNDIVDCGFGIQVKTDFGTSLSRHADVIDNWLYRCGNYGPALSVFDSTTYVSDAKPAWAQVIGNTMEECGDGFSVNTRGILWVLASDAALVSRNIIRGVHPDVPVVARAVLVGRRAADEPGSVYRRVSVVDNYVEDISNKIRRGYDFHQLQDYTISRNRAWLTGVDTVAGFVGSHLEAPGTLSDNIAVVGAGFDYSFNSCTGREHNNQGSGATSARVITLAPAVAPLQPDAANGCVGINVASGNSLTVFGAASAFALGNGVVGDAKATVLLYSNVPGTQGTYGTSVVFGGASSSRRRAGLAMKFTGADVNQGGLACLIKGSTTSSSDALAEAWVTHHDGGFVVGSPTGGSKGAGTINAVAVYDDDVLLTCAAAASEFFETGTVDLAKWDAMVPDRIIPAHEEFVPEVEEVEVEEVEVKKTGKRYVRERRIRKEERPKVRRVPVLEADGRPAIDANGQPIVVEEPVGKTRKVPETRIPRRHEVIHLFARMVDDGFDPRDPRAYIARLRRDEALPGMPTQAEWRHNAISTGEIVNRLWLATEMLALVVVNHEERIAALETMLVR